MLRPVQTGAIHGAESKLRVLMTRWAVRLAAVAVVGAPLLLSASAKPAGEVATSGRAEPVESAELQVESAELQDERQRDRPRPASSPEQNPIRVDAALHLPSRPGGSGAVAHADRVRDAAMPSIRREVFDAFQAAAGAQESDRTLLFALAWRESRFDPHAENTASSARGLMQFTRATWLEAIRDHGAAHGLVRYASAVVTDRASGSVSVRDSRVLTKILALRDDPRLSATMAMARLGRERDSLARALQRPVTDADLYLIHFLGPVGAKHFLSHLARVPSHRASDYVGREAVAANRSVFVTSKGRHFSLREVYTAIQRTLGSQRTVYARLAERVRRQEGRVEVASAR